MAVQTIDKLKTRRDKTIVPTGGISSALKGKTGADLSPKTSNISDIAADMMSKDNRLMERARTQGMGYANSRGLLNSTIAGEAAQNAVLDKIVPMASQESQQRFTSQLEKDKFGYDLKKAKQGFGFAQALSEQDFEQSKGLQAQKGKITSALSKQEFKQASKLSDKDFKQKMGLTKVQYQNEMKLQDKRIGNERFLANLDADTRKSLMDMESATKLKLAEMDLDAKDKSDASAMVTSMHEMYQKSVASILSNPNLPASERNKLLKASGELLQVETKLVEGLYGIDFDWVKASFDPTTAGEKKEDKKDTKNTATKDKDEPSFMEIINSTRNAGMGA